MSLIGKMIKWNKFLGLLSLLTFSNNLFCEDFSQPVMGQTLDPDKDMEKTYKDIETNSIFLPENANTVDLLKTDKKSPFISGYDDQQMEKKLDKNAPNVGVTPVGTFSNAENYLEHDMQILLHDIEMKGKKSISLNYYKDTFDYVSKGDVFNKVYRDDPKSYNPGTLQLAYNYFYVKKEYLDCFVGANIGFGYNQGPGVFIYSREVSDVTFRLITLPTDFSIGFGLRPGKWLKLNLEGGPSAMGLYQSRSDRDAGEYGKRRRQVGFGYYGQGSLKISMSNIFPKYYHSLYYGMNLTKVWLNVLARYHNYSNFQDDIQISGASLGVGFSFESF